MVFNATFNNSSVISWRSVLLVEETGGSLVVGFTTTSAVSITIKIVSWNPVHGEVYSIQHYVMNFASDLLQVGGFLRVLRFPPPIKLTVTI
jgi:hypothetical protein